MHRYAPERTLHLFDTFGGFDPMDLADEIRTTGLDASTSRFAGTSVATVLRGIGHSGNRVRVYPGRLPESCPPELANRVFAFVHLDADLYSSTLAGLRYFYPRTSDGGFIVIHDYNAWPGAREAVDSFLAGKPEIAIPMPDKNGSAVILKLARMEHQA